MRHTPYEVLCMKQPFSLLRRVYTIVYKPETESSVSQ